MKKTKQTLEKDLKKIIKMQEAIIKNNEIERKALIKAIISSHNRSDFWANWYLTYKRGYDILDQQLQILHGEYYEMVRAYNGLSGIKKFLKDHKDLDIKKHNKRLPENQQFKPEDYEGVKYKSNIMESGKVQHTWTIKKKKKK